MSKKRECFACDETTSKPLSDFYLIKWNAFSLGKEEATCACPKHSDKLIKHVMDERFVKGQENEQ